MCEACAEHQESSSLWPVGNRSMRYDRHVREMPSASQLILGTTPRDHFLLELGLLDLRSAARFLASARVAPIPPIRSGLLFKLLRSSQLMNTEWNNFCSRNVNDRARNFRKLLLNFALVSLCNWQQSEISFVAIQRLNLHTVLSFLINFRWNCSISFVILRLLIQCQDI